ncbi:hypothetical protein [Sphingomonas sp. URHD0057]|uniref:hypothetical protein n=1 Tax=Sphingomonas sp. URHD0057 TaxID=1380389 RepID=UPI0012DBF175|nr:hypothetical protein [Sphingomonas sp. URHD0057]
MRLKAGLGAFAAAALGAIGWACAGGPDAPTWTLVKPEFDEYGSAAVLLPSNDTRVNLLLLLADRRGAIVRDPNAKAEGVPLALFPWSVMSEKALPPVEPDYAYDRYYGTRCQSNQAGAAAFIAAVLANAHLDERDRAKLIAARQNLSPEAKEVHQYIGDLNCGAAPLSNVEALSPPAREFAVYLSGARDFYAGEFVRSESEFRELAKASDPWLRETASYMVARTLLTRALEKSMTQWGSLEKDPAKRDAATVSAAGTAFQSYLKDYPDGFYSASARGLMRRVYWLTGNDTALAAEYAQQVDSRENLADAAAAIELVDEIDNKLPLPTLQPQAVRDPILLAVVDLNRMRHPEDESLREYCCGPAITKAEIDGQRAQFGNDSELFDYVRAAEASFVRHQPGEVLQLLPDAARQPRFTYLQFSRQMLRGLALEAAGDRNARGFWLSLFSGAVQPYQREAVELELALHDEKAGRLDLVFAPSSPVAHPIMRAILLEEVAGPDLLRQQASRPGVPQYEREAALYTLLTKEVRRGYYRSFIGDARLVPADAPADAWYSPAIFYSPRWSTTLNRPPLGKYGPKAPLGDYGCPALTATLSQLVAKPASIRGRLCLGEYFRANGFTWYPEGTGTGYYDALHKPGTLGSSRELFPQGRPYSRLEDYKAIMSDRAATADEKALALNRAVRCYAPSHSNDCGGVEVSLAVRRGWFNRLRAQYPQSRWAKDLKYYW